MGLKLISMYMCFYFVFTYKKEICSLEFRVLEKSWGRKWGGNKEKEKIALLCVEDVEF